MKKYQNLDPRYITTRFNSSCDTCQQALPKGTTALYFPASARKIHCVPCGLPDYSRFIESLQDEQFYLGLYWSH